MCKGHVGILFDEQNGFSRLIDFLDDLENITHQNGRESHGRFVQQQHLRIGHERAAHGQHLLLAAGEHAAQLLSSLLQAREQFKDVFQVGGDLGFVFPLPAGKLQIFQHGKIAEDAPAFRYVGDARGDNLIGGNFF